jgi:hypothetical protein
VRNPLVDFALTEAAYTVVRILQEFSSVNGPDDEVVELLGPEKQAATLTVSTNLGCGVWIE